MANSKIVVTVSGSDKIGIVSAFTKVLADCKVNIEDIKQTIMQTEFVMLLLGDIEKSPRPFKEIKQALLDMGAKTEMEVWVQRKDIFDKMHTV